ncbi:MAG TPA: NAD(P)H-binding protein [Polyangiaceae bacterium]|nr:NAD(P)H-binding protein [Polyangiaceae bacterium]
MQRALVIGSSGSFGRAMTQELLARGWSVRALRRSQGRPLSLAGVEEVSGDALELEDVARAAQGAHVIVHGYNSPYPEWERTQVRAARAVARAAVEQRACLLVPGNVYGLGPDFERPLREDCERRPSTRKGRIRNQVEAVLEQATLEGAQLINVRCGDYFGPDAPNTWLHFITQRALRGGALIDPGPTTGVPHEWAYLPDVAHAAAELLQRRFELSSNETFHFSSQQLSSVELVRELLQQLGPRRVWRLPWRLLRWLSPFAPLLRELVEMKYLWDQPVLLDDGKLRRFLGSVRRTPLELALRASLGLPAEGRTEPAMDQQLQRAAG